PLRELRVSRGAPEARVPLGADRGPGRRAIPGAAARPVARGRFGGSRGHPRSAEGSRPGRRAERHDSRTLGLEAGGVRLLLPVRFRAGSPGLPSGRPRDALGRSDGSPRNRALEMMRRIAVACAGVLLAAAALAATEDILRLPIGDPARKDKTAPLVLDAITETATGSALKPSELPARVASVRILFVGEGHVSPESHAVELAV